MQSASDRQQNQSQMPGPTEWNLSYFVSFLGRYAAVLLRRAVVSSERVGGVGWGGMVRVGALIHHWQGLVETMTTPPCLNPSAET